MNEIKYCDVCGPLLHAEPPVILVNEERKLTVCSRCARYAKANGFKIQNDIIEELKSENEQLEFELEDVYDQSN